MSISRPGLGLWRAKEWPKRLLVAAVHRGFGLIAEVGTGPTLRHWGGVAIHIRRQVTREELCQLERLTPGWCAIPAQDTAGADELILDSDLQGDTDGR